MRSRLAHRTAGCGPVGPMVATKATKDQIGLTVFDFGRGFCIVDSDLQRRCCINKFSTKISPSHVPFRQFSQM